jgi:hypothetical protein
MMICLALLGAACGGNSDNGDGGAASCSAYVVPSGTSLSQPTVSLKSDVMKLFNDNCGLSSCHGSVSAPEARLFLGAESARGSDASMVRVGLVGQAAAELPSMPLVTAGDPANSYIMHKLDGDQCQLDSRCSDGSCMAMMPSGATQPLPVETRDTLRRWIAQGAGDD